MFETVYLSHSTNNIYKVFHIVYMFDTSSISDKDHCHTPHYDLDTGRTHTGVTVDVPCRFLTGIRVRLDIAETTCMPGHWENRTAKVL